MNLAWIAAVLRPHDVAPHPNFTDEEYAKLPAGQLAALVIGGDWSHQSRGSEVRESALEYAEKSMQFDTMKEGVDGLVRSALSGTSTDMARSTALALLACQAAAEMEDFETCERLINQLLTEVDASAAGQLCRAVLLQQRALRRRDAGREFADDVFSSARILEHLVTGKIADFPLSPGVSSKPSETVAEIAYALKRACWSLIPQGYDEDLPFPEFPSYMERLRLPLSHRIMRIAADRDSVRSRYELKQFKRLYASSETTLGGAPDDLFHDTLALELIGHGDVYRSRRDQALLRLIRHAEGEAGVEVHDCLRLLRHAGATKELELALNRFRSAGPLSVLSWDARQVLLRRSTPDLLRVPELMVLRAAADLLSPSEAERALSSVLASISAGGPPDLPGSWQHGTLRMSAAWEAGAALANACSQGNEIALVLLAAVRDESSHGDFIDQNAARVVRIISWRHVCARVKKSWLEWLNGPQAQTYDRTAESISVALGSSPAPETMLDGIEGVAKRLNSYLVDSGQPLSLNEQSRAIEIVKSDLRSVRNSAEQGRYAFGSRSSADIAAVLVREFRDVGELWMELATFLTSPHVARIDRDIAFDRLTRDRPQIPELAREVFVAARKSLLREKNDFGHLGESQISPYPAALRFVLAHDLIDEADAIAYVAELSGSSFAGARSEAARTLAVAVDKSSREWVLSLALQMSHESDIRAKGHSARVLARISASSGAVGSVAERRLVALLEDEDGLLVPFYVLRELRGLGKLPDSVVRVMQSLARDHPSNEVRRAAKEGVEEAAGSENK